MVALGPQTIITLVFASGLLATGCMTTIFSKSSFQMRSKGIDNEIHFFSKPWIQTMIMFLGMMVLLVMFICEKVREYVGIFRQREGRSAAQIKFWRYIVKSSVILMAPGIFDLTATGISSMGLSNPAMSSSVYQMLGGAVMVYSGVLSIIFLKTKLASFQWIGIGLCVVGLIFVGFASTLHDYLKGDGLGDIYGLLLGIFDVLLAQFLWSCQFVVEEFLLQSLDCSAAQVVGTEGVYGTIWMSLIVLPIMNIIPGSDTGGVWENTLDTFVMFRNNAWLWIPNLGFLIAIMLYNYCGQSVTKRLSCVHRTILEACRSLFVWVVSIALHYISMGRFGEPVSLFSIIQLFGFVILTLGSLIHNKIIKVPGLNYAAEKTEEAREEYDELTGEASDAEDEEDRS